MDFVNWDDRPAVLGESEARAMLKPNSDWVNVDAWDVWSTAGIMSEAAWRERFKSFGELSPPILDQSGPASAEAAE
jgi:hypothetical protein